MREWASNWFRCSLAQLSQMNPHNEFEFDDDHLREYISEEAYGSHERKWADVRDGYAFLKEHSPCTTSDLVEAVSGNTVYGDGWMYLQALPAIRAAPGVEYRGWRLALDVDEEPRGEDELRELAVDVVPEGWREAEYAQAYVATAYQVLADRDADDLPTTYEFKRTTRRSAGSYCPWDRAERAIRKIDEVRPPDELAWRFNGGAGDE